MIKINKLPCPNPDALVRGNYKEASNKSALKLSSHDKCMYCESKIPHIDFGQVEHIKPKDADKFPDLEFEWVNLGYACPLCNNAKSNKYYAEAPFIDPYNENPSEHLFAFGSLLFHKNGSQRGEVTIKEIQLNRAALVEKRNLRIESIRTALDACHRTSLEVLRTAAFKELQAEADSSKEYSLFVQALLTAHAL